MAEHQPSEAAVAWVMQYLGSEYTCSYSGTIAGLEDAFDAGRSATPNDALIEEVRAMVKRLTRLKFATSDNGFTQVDPETLTDAAALITRLMEGRG